MHPTSRTAAFADRVGRTFASLQNRNYRWYFAGQGVSLVGTWMQSTTQAWLVLTITHSGTALGMVVALQTLPILLFGPVGGTIADRFGKYRILFWTQSLAGLQAGALAALELSGHLRLWELYLIACSLGFVNMVDNPTRQTFIVEMVGREQLANAVTLNSVMVNVARAIGPAVGGVLIATVGSGWCFLFNAASFAFVIVALTRIDRTRLEPAELAPRKRGQLVEGFRYVAATPVLRNALAMMAIIGCLAYEFQVSVPLMARNVFHGGSQLYGLLNSAQGMGAVVGGLLVAGRPRTGPRRLVGTAAVFGVVMVGAALAPNAATEVVALLAVGAASVTFLALGNTTLQLAAEPSMRGRVMSLWSVAFLGSTPIGGPLVGLVAGTLGARFGLGVGAAAIGVAVVIGWRATRGDVLAAASGGAGERAGSVDDRAAAGAPRPDGAQRVAPPARTA